MDKWIYFALIFLCMTTEKSSVHTYNLPESEISEEFPSSLTEMGKKLDKIPIGRFHVKTVNLAYNDVRELTSYVFYVNLYKNLQQIELGQNKIAKISSEAFRELRQLKSVDLSANNVTYIEPNTFRHNQRLEKLDLSDNKLSFDPEKTFLRSVSLETLIVSQNRVTHVFDITFARLPNLRNLLLDGNALYYLSQNCFAHLKHLQYVSFADTEVYRLSAGMFRTLPKVVDLNGTPLSNMFDPPLRKVRNSAVAKLVNVETYIFGDDYLDT